MSNFIEEPASKETQPKSTEVFLSPRRKRYTPAFKLRVIEEADRCAGTGEVAALCRREGIYFSTLTDQQQKYDAAWAYLNGRPTDKWAYGTFGDDKSTGDFPWMLLGYTAAKRGDPKSRKLAEDQLRYFLNNRQGDSIKPPFTSIEEISFAIRLQQQLQKPK